MRARRRWPYSSLLASTALCAAGIPCAFAADAIWTGFTDSNYNSAANWLVTGPPDGFATFGSTTGSKTPTITANTSADAWSFAATGVNWVFSNQQTFSFTGAGIDVLTGTATINNLGTIGGSVGTINFNGSSTAGTATINNQSVNANVAITNFNNTSTAGNANITNSGGALGGTGFTVFNDSSTAGSATITATRGGFIVFLDTSSGGTARLITEASGPIGFTPGELNIELVAGAGTAAGSIEGSGTVALGSKRLTVGGNNLSTEFSGVISGLGGSLTKVGSGILTLSGANTYTSETSINGGTIQATNNSALGSSELTFNGGTFQAGANGLSFSNDINASSAGTIDTQAHTLTLSGPIAGAGTLTKIGTGTLVLTGNSTFNGGLTLNGGTLSIGHNNALGTGTLTVLGSTLNLQNNITVSNVVDLQADLTIDVAGGAAGAYAGNIGQTGGAFGIVKGGAGTLTLSGANTYGGGTALNAGIVSASADGNLGAATGALTFDGGTLQFGASFNLAGTRAITLNAGGGTVDTNGFDTTISQAITGAGSFTKIGAGGLTLSAAPTHNSQTIVNDGTLTFAAASAHNGGNVVNGGTMTVSGAGTLGAATNTLTVNGGTVDLATTSQTTGALTLTGGTIQNGTLTSSAFGLQAGTVSAVLAGAAGVSKTGAGTVTLSNVNTYTGATSIGAGTLALTGTGSVAASSGVNLTASGATFDISGTTAGTSVANLQGVAGSVLALGSRTLTVSSGSSAFAGNITGTGGGITLNGGTLLLSGTGHAFTGPVTVNAGILAFDNNNSVSGSGGVVMNGGTLRFDGQSAFTNNPIVLNANVTFDVADFGQISGTLSGNGGFTKTGSGNLFISGGNHTYVGPTVVTGGMLQVVGSNLASTSYTLGANTSFIYSGTIAAGSTFDIAGTARISSASFGNATFAVRNGGLLSGPGLATVTLGTAAITVDSGGTVRLGGILNNTTSGGNSVITNNGGRVIFANNATAANATINNNTNAELLFAGTGVTAGNAVITNASSALTQTLFGAGGTLPGGIVFTGEVGGGVIVTGITAGNANINNLATGTIRFEGGSTAGDAVIANAGTLSFISNSTTGNATITGGGTIALNTSDTAGAATVTLNSGGLLMGNGSVGTTTVNAGATVAPGNSIGTIIVNGNLTFNNGSNYIVEVSPTAADRLNVNGTATLNGSVTMQAIALPGSFRARTYTIINTTGGVNGAFSALTISGTFAPGARNPRLTYDANNVYLVLDPGTITLPPGTIGNSSDVANGINNAILSGGTPPAGFDVLLNLTEASQRNVLTQVSGQAPTGASLAATQMMNGFLSLTLNPGGGAPNSNPGALGYARAVGGSDLLPTEAADAYAAIMPVQAGHAANFGSRWSAWGQGYGGYNKTDGNATTGIADTTSRAYGFAAGADYRLTQATTLGFALAGGEMYWGLAQGLGGGRSDVFQAGVYASHRMGAAYVSAAIAYAWYGMQTDRMLFVSGADALRATFDAHNVGARLEAGYRVATQYADITPYVAGQVQNFRTPGYSESAIAGSNQFALAYGPNTTTASRFELGSWSDKLIALNDGRAIMLRGRAAWAHDEGNRGGMSAVFQTLPGSGFTVNGAAAPRDIALVSAGGEYRLARGPSLSARFDGEFASRAQTYAGTATARYIW